ncbi:MAG TPA: TonB-dependent receptor, partial [Chitinophagaceae bacterium]|nr:TonB-dependent receptor [Chitinophagaceae bacterium]
YDSDPSFGNYKSKTLFAEAYTNVYLAEHLGLLAGVDYRGQKANIETTYGNLGSDSLHTDQVSGYASLLLKSIEGFSAELGGRYTHHSQFGSAFTYSINPSYLINKQVKVFVNISSGFRSPSIYNIASEYGNRNIKPEKSMSYEGGIQYINSSNTVNLRATAFARDIRDVIIFKSLFVAPYGQYDNANKQKDKGFELEATVRPADKWNITANYSYVDGKVTAPKGSKDTSYFNLYRRPKNTVNTTVGFQACRKFYASVGLRWVDKRQDQFYNSNTFSVENKTLASYYNLNVYGAWQATSYLKAFVDLQNVTDQQYFDAYGYNSRRFNFMAGVSVRF